MHYWFSRTRFFVPVRQEAMFADVNQPIYLDNNATTRLDERVLEAMLPYLREAYGNPSSSSHAYGWTAEAAVVRARADVAEAIGAAPQEIVFTSGATESDNLAIFGIAEAYGGVGKHIVTVETEHKAILEPCHALERRGWEVTVLGVDSQGFVDIDELERALRKETVLVSVMYGNNEIGTLQNLARIGAACRERQIIFHSDATQGIGQLPFHVDEMNVDLASFTAHKMYGPKGCGALYVRREHPRVRLARIQLGGSQESGFRAGTVNVPGVVGLAAALRLAVDEMPTSVPHRRQLRDRLLNGLRERLGELGVNGPDPTTHDGADTRLPGTINIYFPGVDTTLLMTGVRDVAISSGSACASTVADSSHVLRATDPTGERARSSIRFGLGRFTTAEEIERAIDLVSSEAAAIRKSHITHS